MVPGSLLGAVFGPKPAQLGFVEAASASPATSSDPGRDRAHRPSMPRSEIAQDRDFVLSIVQPVAGLQISMHDAMRVDLDTENLKFDRICMNLWSSSSLSSK